MRNQILVPISIVVAGAVVAVAIYFVNKQGVTTTTPNGDTIVVRPVDSTDHILGNPNAAIKLIEYSDFECPHCKTYHNTLKQVMSEYGANGEVAWVFRHFPIAQLHSKAPKEAEAAECAADLGGNDAFFKFADRLYEVTPSNNGLDLNSLADIAGFVGLDKAAFQSCLDSGKFASKVQSQFDEGVKAGIRGTPHIFISAAGEYLPLEGSQPIGSLRSAINVVTEELKKNTSTTTPQ